MSESERAFPHLVNTVVDAVDAREVAEFYRRLLGLDYRPGQAPDPDSADDDWLVLVDAQGQRVLAVQRVAELPRSTWPTAEVPMQLHLCFIVDDPGQLAAEAARAQELGAILLRHRTEDPAEPLFVLADPAGHPFCLYTHP